LSKTAEDLGLEHMCRGTAEKGVCSKKKIALRRAKAGYQNKGAALNLAGGSNHA